MRTGVYPGSFDPPTIAHLAIADAARQQRRLDRVVLVVSEKALAKEHVVYPLLEHRIAVLHQCVADVEWLEVSVTDKRLLADISSGYDVLILGADKYEQIQDPAWYDDAEHRSSSLLSLPELAIAPRPPHQAPPEHVLKLDLETIAMVSSSAARAGELELMVGEAREFARRTGAWIDEPRYLAWLAQGAPGTA